MAKPNIVVVPGAWQFASSFNIFRDKLIAHGYPTQVIELPSAGSPQPRKSLEDDAVALRAMLSRTIEQGKQVVVIAHSYGGVVASNSVQDFILERRQEQGKDGGVVHLIYMCAFVLPKGKSLLEMFPGGKPPPWQYIEDDAIKVLPSEVLKIAFNDFSAAEIEEHAPEVTHISVSCFNMPATYEPWKDMKCSYIFTTEDLAVPYPIQKQMASQFGEAKTFELKAGHCPHIRMPDEVIEGVELLLKGEA